MTDAETSVLDLRWDLAELPTSQHRAGLAGLLLTANLAPRRGGQREATADSHSLSLRIDEAGLAELFDSVYGATTEIRWESKVRKKKGGDEVTPVDTRTVEKAHPKTGKKTETTQYAYEQKVPAGAWLTDLYPDDSRWLKLWRDFVWSQLRGIPKTRGPYEERAEKRPSSDATTAFNELCNPGVKPVAQKSHYLLGAMAVNAEGVPFEDRARYQFLLHFWPLVAQLYVPAYLDDARLKFRGYVVAVPDIADLQTFATRLKRVLKDRDEERIAYRPAAAVVYVPEEGALEIASSLASSVAEKAHASRTARTLLAVDVFHVDKPGNSLQVLSATRVVPTRRQEEGYREVRARYRDALFLQQRMKNFLAEKDWHDGFSRLLQTTPVEQTAASSWFSNDVRRAFEDEVYMEEDKKELERLVLKYVRDHLRAKSDSKLDTRWAKVSDDPKKRSEYNRTRSEIAKRVFLAVRSRTGDDFIEYFAASIASTPSFLKDDEFVLLAKALRTDTDTVRTLTLLALSAQSWSSSEANEERSEA